MTSLPPNPDDREALRRAEAALAEERAARLAAEERLREHEEADAGDASDGGATAASGDARRSLSLFDSPQMSSRPTLAADGSDPGVLPMALLGLAVVAGLAAGLALLNGRVTFGVVMLAATGLLGWAAHASWVSPVEVSVNRGVVYVEQGQDKHRFDLRSEATHLEVLGVAGDLDWQVRFARRGLDPVVVHAGHVDPQAFLAQLRHYRPDL